jgi:hypothetical protein
MEKIVGGHDKAPGIAACGVLCTLMNTFRDRGLLTPDDLNLCLLRSRGSDSNWLECARELPNNRIQPTAFGRG